MKDRQSVSGRIGSLLAGAVPPRGMLSGLLSLVGGLTLVGTLYGAPEIPGAVQRQPLAVVGATIHPVSGPVVTGADLLWADGKIVAVGRNLQLPAGTRRIDGRGRHVYPGLFESHSNLGLVEINSVRASRDFEETGRLNPNVRAHLAVNPDSELIPVTRSNGILLAMTAPSGGLVSGQCSVLQLDGWTYEDLTLRPDVGLFVHWPGVPDPLASGSKGDPLAALRELVEEARAYGRARAESPQRQGLDARLEAMQPVLDGRQPLIVEADDLDRIRSALAFAARHQLRLILFGGYDAEYCAESLKRQRVPVIVAGVYRLPRRRHEEVDLAYSLPARLHRAGVTFCISSAGRFGASGVRNLPYHAATAAAYGLPLDQALRAITLSPAEILGVADRVGSLEPGKDATLIVTDGDPLETETQVLQAFVGGRQVDLSDKHKRLYDKYRAKYDRRR